MLKVVHKHRGTNRYTIGTAANEAVIRRLRKFTFSTGCVLQARVPQI